MRHSVENVLAIIEGMNDAEVLRVHRLVSRRASQIRLSDPDYLSRYQTGMIASRARIERESESRQPPRG